ncbi:sialate O-acetylesterase [Priestia aryabhattai]|uniref:sialate O-acetylesterase n=1 Tax=Priestia aryabhattai TaxID=412384 RepID=UPI003C9A1BCC
MLWKEGYTSTNGALRLHDSLDDTLFYGPVDAFISAGQSNESGRGELTNKETGIPQVTTFGNDYLWKQLEEPTDSPVNQVDSVSKDGDGPAHSSLVKFGKDLYTSIQKPISIIPNSLGGTSIQLWQPPATRFDRTTLFGSMDYRIQKTLENNRVIKAFLWFQGEHDSGFAEKTAVYTEYYLAFINALRSYYGVVPFFYTQLATTNYYTSSAKITEQQRLLETGNGNSKALAKHYMIVTHDLSFIDTVHLDKAGQIELGRRRALAVRQYLYGHSVNGTGPRLVSITQPTPNTIKVKTTKTINDHNTYENYFKAFDNNAPVTIQSLGRDPADDTAVLITLGTSISGTMTIDYTPPSGRSLHTRVYNIVKDSAGLPLPLFGPIGLTN